MLLLLLRHVGARLLKEEEQEVFSSVATGLIAVAQEMLHAANDDNSNRNHPNSSRRRVGGRSRPRWSKSFLGIEKMPTHF